MRPVWPMFAAWKLEHQCTWLWLFSIMLQLLRLHQKATQKAASIWSRGSLCIWSRGSLWECSWYSIHKPKAMNVDYGWKILQQNACTAGSCGNMTMCIHISFISPAFGSCKDLIRLQILMSEWKVIQRTAYHYEMSRKVGQVDRLAWAFPTVLSWRAHHKNIS